MSRLIKNEHALEWVLIKQYCEDRLTELREENEMDHPEVATARLRGMIEFAKEIRDLDVAEPELREGQSLKYIDFTDQPWVS